MLAESAAISDRITHSAVFEPWGHVETTSPSQVVADVYGCLNEALDRRRVVRDSQEQWYAVGGIRPSSEDSNPDPVSRFQISWRRGESSTFLYVSLLLFFLVPVIYVFLLGSQKSGQFSRSPVKRRFGVASASPASQQHRIVEDLSFSAALDRQQSCKKSWRSERKRGAPVFQGELP